MDLLFVMDPMATVRPDHDTTYDLMCAGAARKHRIYWCEQKGVRFNGAHVVADAIELDPVPFYKERDVRTLDLRQCVTFMRKDPPVDSLYMHTTHLLLHAMQAGARVYNRPDALLLLNEKLAALRFPQWIPETLVTASLADARAFAHKHGKVVLKPLDGNGGKAVFVAHHDDSNLMPLLETLTAEGRRQCIVQQFLKDVTQGDKRIVLVNGDPIGALNRVPAAGEHRANLHVGGSAMKTGLTETEKAICADLKPFCVDNGLLLVGIDVIGGRLTEINVTSPTGVHEIRRLSGIDVSPRVIQHVEGNA